MKIIFVLHMLNVRVDVELRYKRKEKKRKKLDRKLKSSNNIHEPFQVVKLIKLNKNLMDFSHPYLCGLFHFLFRKYSFSFIDYRRHNIADNMGSFSSFCIKSHSELKLKFWMPSTRIKISVWKKKRTYT